MGSLWVKQLWPFISSILGTLVQPSHSLTSNLHSSYNIRCECQMRRPFTYSASVAERYGLKKVDLKKLKKLSWYLASLCYSHQHGSSLIWGYVIFHQLCSSALYCHYWAVDFVDMKVIQGFLWINKQFILLHKPVA